jgi:beta-barrel assembly-enhancing protease
MINFKTIQFLFVASISIVSINAQVDFDKYRTLKAEGEVPEVFRTNLGEKYAKAIKTTYKDLNSSQKQIFVHSTVINIHDMLFAGDIIFGDTITRYINKIADKICGDDTELRDKLSFYTSKSYYTNALSTEQGIIFISTGLIGQVTNEAQLAFVIAHEIAHFEKGHSLEKFEELIDQIASNGTMEKVMEFSREKENEADERGVELFSKAGYKISELNGSMDVLMYSYLPFDEVPVGKDYFNNKYVTFTLDRFGSVGGISAVDDFDDSKSTHPNISERRTNIDTILKKVGGAGEILYISSQKEFKYIRTISRFEMLRSYLGNEDFINAMYASFLLEKEFPNSYFIKKCKARVWYGIASYDFKDGNDKNDQKQDWEGEVSLMYNFVKSMSGLEKVVYAARVIEDVRKEYPDVLEMQVMSQRSIRLLAKTENFKLESFSSEVSTPLEYKELEDVMKNWDVPTLNKYQKIARKRGLVRKSTKKEKVRPDHEYWIPDLAASEEFISNYKEEKRIIDKEQEAEKELEKLNSKQLLEKENEILVKKMKTSDNRLLIVQPSISSVSETKTGSKPNLEKYNTFEVQILSSFKKIAAENRISTYNVGIKEIKSQGATVYNELMTIYNVLGQSYESNEEYLPIDFEDLEELKDNYSVNKLVWPIFEHEKSRARSRVILTILFSPLIAPIVPYALANNLTGRHKTSSVMAVFDLNTYTFGGYYRSITNAKPTKLVLGSQVYNFLTTIKK